MDCLDVLIDEAQVGTRACDAIEILPLASAMPSNRWLPNRGPCQAGVHAYQALPCRLGLSIAADHNTQGCITVVQLICGSTTVLYSTHLPTVPGTGCTDCSA